MHQIIDEIAGFFLLQKRVKALCLQWFSRTHLFPLPVNIEVCRAGLSQPSILAENYGRFAHKCHPVMGGE